MPKDTELHKLCGKGDFDGVQSLLSPSAKPVNVDEPGSSGRTPLHRAIGANANDIVKLLVEAHGASLTTVDATGRSILQFAVIAKNAAMLQYLLEKDESMINHLTEKGSSCLHLAVNTGSHACIEQLLNRNIDTQLKNKKLRGITVRLTFILLSWCASNKFLPAEAFGGRGAPMCSVRTNARWSRSVAA